MAKGVKQFVAEANAAIKTVTVEEAKGLVGQPGVVFLDVRDADELRRTGRIPGAAHVSRGMLEFGADPTMPSHNKALDPAKRIVVSCAGKS